MITKPHLAKELLSPENNRTVITTEGPHLNSRRLNQRWPGVRILLGCISGSLCVFYIFYLQSLVSLKRPWVTLVTQNNPAPSSLSSVEWPIPRDVTLGECAQWNNDSVPSDKALPPYHLPLAEASFKLPISSDTIFFLARGEIGGSVRIQLGGKSSDVEVKVKAYSWEVKERLENGQIRELLELVRVCAVTRGKDENGLGIFSKHHEPSHIYLHGSVYRFEVIVFLPKSAGEGSLLNLKGFETDMTRFAHYVDDLRGSVYFDSFTSKTTQAPIHVTSVEAERAWVVTDYSPIDGEFQVSSSLLLRTHNAPINTRVTLHNAHGKDPTKLDISTNNANLNASVILKSGSSTKTGGKFKISTTTSHAPLDLSFLEAPVDSMLDIEAGTFLAPSTISIHPTYEGSFVHECAISTLPGIVVECDDMIEDPAGKRRQRRVHFDEPRRDAMVRVSGTVRWCDLEEDDCKSAEASRKGSIRTRFSDPLTLKI